jgi:RimJ/RimL family protein N-acetyltransferase
MMAAPDPWPTLSTSRLTLRPLQSGDAPALSRLVDDPGVATMTTSIPHPFPEGAAEAFIDRMARVEPDREGVFALETTSDGFIGVLGFHPDGRGAVEVGYWLGRPFWGQGYMTEAVEAALGWAGAGWGRRYLLAGHFADNPASGQVLVKAGFLYTGDVVPRFSMARGEEAPTRMMVWLA